MALLYLLLTEDRTFGLTWLLPILLALAAIAALFAERQHAHRIRRWLVLSANAMVTVSFLDYVFLAFNTNTAFSPTDTLVLSPRAKLCMMLQSSVALVDVAVIVARAVGTFQG